MSRLINVTSSDQRVPNPKGETFFCFFNSPEGGTRVVEYLEEDGNNVITDVFESSSPRQAEDILWSSWGLNVKIKL